MAVSFPEITHVAYADAVQAAFPGQVVPEIRRGVAILCGCSMRFAAVGDYQRFLSDPFRQEPAGVGPVWMPPLMLGAARVPKVRRIAVTKD